MGLQTTSTPTFYIYGNQTVVDFPISDWSLLLDVLMTRTKNLGDSIRMSFIADWLNAV